MKQLDLQDSGEIKDMVEITVRVDFDSIDKAILNIFNRYHGRSYKVSQILIYEIFILFLMLGAVIGLDFYMCKAKKYQKTGNQ